ncbi:MAG TPA: hypothetical protein VHB97_12525 [Polyangia bacterium]|nr:hypothetical protein [Polyangia bacterium]
MRLSLALVALGFFAAGCGDDTTSPSSGLDLSVAQDLAGGPTCAAYCAKIEMNCTAGTDGGGHAQYTSANACNTYCTSAAAWPAGKVGDVSGNTIGCRLYHAGAAASDPTTHCPHAGPTGGDMCGSWCDNYCQLMAKNCTGSNAVYDMATCMTKCATIPTTGMPNDTSGNTVQCRIYHLGVAATDPVTHCPHSKTAADLPTGPCT